MKRDQGRLFPSPFIQEKENYLAVKEINFILKNILKYYKHFLTTFGKLFKKDDKVSHNGTCID